MDTMLAAINRAEMIERVLRDAEKRKGTIEREVIATVHSSMNDPGLPTPDDYKRIAGRLDKIEKTLGEIQQQMERSLT